jgi:5'(3')-deoxyribonucleotidase
MAQAKINFLKDHKKVVGCDLDDVLANFIQKFMDIAHELHGVDPKLRPSDWEWTGLGKTPEETVKITEDVWAAIIANPYFWTELEVEPGASVDLVQRLELKTKLYFPTARAVTAGGVDVGFQSAQWLLNNFDILFPTVIVGDKKGPLANALKYDYFVDDRPKNCVEVKAARPECQVFLKTASHNTTIVLPGIERVENFDEFARIVLAEA